MAATLTLELSGNQLELLQEGLRYVRSSRKLAIREVSEAPNVERDEDLRQIARLLEQLQPTSVKGPQTASKPV